MSGGSELPVSRFAPIGLDDLVAESALLTRTDRKYVLRLAEAESLVGALDPRTQVLTIARRRSFRYSSVYFDTPDLLSFRTAAHGRRRRFKVRTRSYLDGGGTFLEVKVQGVRGVTVKERVAHRLPDRLGSAGRGYVQEGLEPLGLPASTARALTPVLRTDYRRTTLTPPGGGLRITLDTDLVWTTAPWSTAQGRRLTAPDLVVVETKSATGAGEVDRLLWRRGHRPDAISKYATGMAALHPDLPGNRWARVLNRHLTEHRIEELRCA